MRNNFFANQRMGKLTVATNGMSEVTSAVNSLMATEDSFVVKDRVAFEQNKAHLTDINAYSGYGISSCGQRIGFPANFLVKHGSRGHEDTVARIMEDCYSDFYARAEQAKDNRSSKSLLIRSFDGLIAGVLTDKYSIFDDNEVCKLLSSNDYLMNAEEIWYASTAERFHARFISKDTLDFDGDSSPLHFCVFVDNSMVGDSSLRVRFGLYRSACTNGMIWDFKSFEIVKECHKGDKEYGIIIAKALENCAEYEETLKKAVEEMAMTKSNIYEMEDEKALSFLRDNLNIGKKACAKILDFYQNTYGGESKWDLANAITEYAHEAESISERVRLERLATKVA